MHHQLGEPAVIKPDPGRTAIESVHVCSVKTCTTQCCEGVNCELQIKLQPPNSINDIAINDRSHASRVALSFKNSSFASVFAFCDILDGNHTSTLLLSVKTFSIMFARRLKGVKILWTSCNNRFTTE